MQLEYGKRYVRRDGLVSGVLGSSEDYAFKETHPFADYEYGCTYTSSGRWSASKFVSAVDLVAEYIEPTAVTHGGPYVAVEVYRAVVAERDELRKRLESPMVAEAALRSAAYESLCQSSLKKPASVPDPGKGYRLLEPSELVIKGDEFLSMTGEWAESVNWRSPIDGEQHPFPYRRKLPVVETITLHEVLVKDSNRWQSSWTVNTDYYHLDDVVITGNTRTIEVPAKTPQ